MSVAAFVRSIPMPLRWLVIGGVSAGLLGAVVGLIVGLETYAPTAWFAVFELGIPAAIVGGILGLAAGTIAFALGHLRNPVASS